MPIVVQHTPDARAVAQAAYQGGLGQFMQAQQEMAQRQAMQNQQIQAQQQMAVFQANNDAQRMLWQANNQDVMANRDMARQGQLGQQRQNFERQQFDWQQGAAQDQRNWQSDQRQQEQNWRERMASDDDQRQRALQAEQLRNQGPLARQMREFDAVEENIRRMPMEDAERADHLAELQKKRTAALGTAKQPTPEEKRAALESELESSVIQKPDGTYWLKGKDGTFEQKMPPKDNTAIEAAKQAQRERDEQAKIAAQQAEDARKAAEEQRKAFRDFYSNNAQKEVAGADGKSTFQDRSPEEIRDMWKKRQEIEAEIFKDPGQSQGGQAAPPPNAGPAQPQRQAPQIAPEAQDLMIQFKQERIPTIHDDRELQALPRDRPTVIMTPAGPKIWDPRQHEPRPGDNTDLTGNYASMPND